MDVHPEIYATQGQLVNLHTISSDPVFYSVCAIDVVIITHACLDHLANCITLLPWQQAYLKKPISLSLLSHSLTRY